ncbi:hypothetical protein [Aeromonas phage AS-szw]|uniref:YopX protein domain-containing protein n=1 Tax=Aeromonas phage AS-szw TaxID=2026114 RepID=A0A291LD29_9CAUD|nr:hypothetical protein [Aeromonas phage AS-szw]
MIFWKKNTWGKLAIGDSFNDGNLKSKIVDINHMYGQIKLDNGVEIKFDSVHSYYYKTQTSHCNTTQWHYAFIDGCLYTFGEREELKVGDVVRASYYDDADRLKHVCFVVKDFFKSDSIIVEIEGNEEILTVGYGHLITLYNDDLPSYFCNDLEVGVGGLVERIRDERRAC